MTNSNKFFSPNTILIASFVLLVVLYFVAKVKHNTELREETPQNEKKLLLADTYIPKGYVLVPIELQNIESVKGLIGQFGIVDLYSENPDKSYSLLAQQVKILRAPLNPEKYAVLISENMSANIVAKQNSLWGVIKNRNEPPVPAKRPTKKDEVEIEYFDGDTI